MAEPTPHQILNNAGTWDYPANETNQLAMLAALGGGTGAALGSTTPVAVAATEKTLTEATVAGSDYMTFSIANDGSMLTDFQVYVLTHASGAYLEIELTEEAYVIDYTTGLTTLADATTGLIRLDVRGLYGIKLTATAAENPDDTAVTVLGNRG